MSCHNATSAFRLAWRLNFSWDVIATRRKHSRFTNAYEIPRIYKRLEQNQNNMKFCHKFDATPVGGLFTRLGT